MNVATLFSAWLRSALSSEGKMSLLPQESGANQSAQNAVSAGSTTAEGALNSASENLPEKLQGHAQEISNTLNESQAVQDISAGILDPIYQLAEFMSLPSFYWVAFALMVAGVVSFAAQLLLSKFFLLFKLSLNFKEILGDALGLIISVVGLVLTTQAATQNSTFPESSVAVVSATAVGAIVGLVFYWWGQQQEFRAVKRAPEKSMAQQSR